MNSRHTRMIGLVLTLLAAAAVAYAAITGVISGTVTDSSGAVVPNVTVVATNQLTGVEHSTVTDSKGFYSFPALDVGIYTITTSVAGFEKFAVAGVTVDANSSIRTDIPLKVGAQTTTVAVTANQVQIDTQSTQLGQVIESTQLTAVPLVTRAFTDLLALQPSVSPYNDTSEGIADGYGGVSGGLNAGNASINGQREDSNGFMVNGIDVNDGGNNGTAVIPNLDSLSEFRIITSNYDAEYGNFNGGQVNVVTKSGTSQFHGSAFEFLRNTDFNAANYFNAGVRSPYDQSIYGGTFGGPIRKDKIFFFADFQGTKTTEGTTEEPNVPSTADLTGNLSDLSSLMTGFDVAGTGWASVLTNRLAGVTGQTVVAGEPYYNINCNNTSASSSAGCVFPNAVIPTAAWDPVSANLFKYIPTSNATLGGVATTLNGLPAVLYTGFPETLGDYKEGFRVDYATHIGTFFAYYLLDNATFVNPFSAGLTTPSFPDATTQRAQLYNLGLTSTLSSTKVNAFRFGYMRSATHVNDPTYSLPGPSLASLGFVTPWGPAGGIGNVDARFTGVPNISINTLSFGTASTYFGRYDNTFQWLDDFTYVHGTHTFQTGIDYHYDQVDERATNGENGAFGFADGQETGSGVADFLLGAEDGSFVQATDEVLDSRSYYLGAYGEDSWRATKTLTLNYGIRYEISTPWWDEHNELETIVPGEQSVVFPGSPVGWVFPGDPGIPRTIAPVKHDKFAPRLGFAYAPQVTGGGLMNKLTGGNATSIRGSFGIFYTNFQDQSDFNILGDAPYGYFYSTPAPVMLSAPYILRASHTIEAQKFPYAWPPTNVSASNPDNNVPWAALEPIGGSPGVDIHNTLPYAEEYTLSIERAFGGSTVLTVNYVGSQGRHWADSESADPGNIALCESLTAAALAPGQTPCGPKLESNLYVLNNGTDVYGTLILNPTNGEGLAFASSEKYIQTNATSNYNSLQANIKHNSNWGEVLVGYTYAKSMDDASALGDSIYPYNPHADYGLSEYDVPQYLVASYNLHLPIANWVSNHTAKGIVGGWSISGISKFAKGTPVSLSESDDHSLTGVGDLPNYNGGNIVGDHNPRDRQPWFNTSLFSKEAIGVYGDSHRRFFVGPGLNQTDLALMRELHIRERNVITLRAEAFNVANHAEFANPQANIDNPSSFGMVDTTQPNNPRVLEIVVKYDF
jgi:hypothetical protein